METLIDSVARLMQVNPEAVQARISNMSDRLAIDYLVDLEAELTTKMKTIFDTQDGKLVRGEITEINDNHFTLLCTDGITRKFDKSFLWILT